MTAQPEDDSRREMAPEEVSSAEEVDQAPNDQARVTKELPAMTADDLDSAAGADAPDVSHSRDMSDLHADALDDEAATRETPAVSAPAGSASAPAGDDLDATVVRPMTRDEVSQVRSGTAQPVQPAQPAQPEYPTPRPRYNTLAGAFNRSRSMPSASDSRPNQGGQSSAPPPVEMSAIADEVDPEDEWSVADQPTIQLSPQQLQSLRPAFLQTGEQPSWPPRPAAASAPVTEPPTYVRPAASPTAPLETELGTGLPPRPRPPFPLTGSLRAAPQTERLAAPDGRVAHSPASGDAADDPRMERFQELRRHRIAHDHGEQATDDVTPVADAVRQWWRDLRPGVGEALQYQREARASGTHPLPAYAPAPTTSRLGDAFGRLAASARGLSERAQQAAAPAFRRIHDQMEQAAQGFIQRFEGDSVRQQAPFLGPGRVAVFFRSGVTVGQAQRLLAASSARPMRLIPRKHGFLARVMPGQEAEVCERLRLHPYVSDVVYLEYDANGEPLNARR